MTLLIDNPLSVDHETPPGHPECIERYHAIKAAISDIDVSYEQAEAAWDSVIELCHPQSYIDGIRAAIPETGIKQIDGDTFVSPTSFEAALRGVGGMTRAVDAVAWGEVRNAFLLSRPPGHHAEQETAMGFCLFGNVAIGARHAMTVHGLDRVAVVDFDVHHGNGTQALLWDEPRAFFATSQQMPLWPGTGERSECGGSDNVLNVPLAPGSDGAAMRAAYGAQVFPRIRAFEPEMILISAGFDAHADDPLAQLNWQVEDFTWLTRELLTLADELCEGRVVSALEGGYDLPALGASVAAHLTEMKEFS